MCALASRLGVYGVWFEVRAVCIYIYINLSIHMYIHIYILV